MALARGMKGEDNVGMALVAHRQAAKLGQPRQCAFYDSQRRPKCWQLSMQHQAMADLNATLAAAAALVVALIRIEVWPFTVADGPACPNARRAPRPAWPRAGCCYGDGPIRATASGVPPASTTTRRLVLALPQSGSAPRPLPPFASALALSSETRFHQGRGHRRPSVQPHRARRLRAVPCMAKHARHGVSAA